jgi:hypothetical protein
MLQKNAIVLGFAAILIAAPVLMFGSALASFAQSSALSIEIEEKDYRTGDTIRVFGTIAVFKENQVPIIQIFNPNGALYRADPVELGSDGTYSYEFKIGGKSGVSGTYRAVVTYGTSQAETPFDFVSVESETVNVVIDGKNYPVRVRGGHFPDWLRSVSADPQSQSLVMSLGDIAEDTRLELELDSNLIDTSAECFVVQADGQEIPADCSPVDNNTTLLSFTLPEGSKELRIVGTFLAPEFGTIAGILLALTMGAIIIAATRYRITGNRPAALP